MQQEMEPEYRPTPEEQERTNRAYRTAFGISLVMAMVLLIGIPIVTTELKLWLHLPLREFNSASAGIGGMSMSLAQLLAIVFCRRKGVSLEARFRERWKVSRRGLGSEASGDPLPLRRSRIVPGLLAGFGIAGIALLWLSLTSPGRNVLPTEVAGAVTTLGGIWGSIILCFGSRLEATVDEAGITFAQRAWYLPGRAMRYLAWRDISHVEIVRNRGVKGHDVGGLLVIYASDGATFRIGLTCSAPEDRIPFLDRVRSETRRGVESVREAACIPTPVHTSAVDQEPQPLVLVRGNS